jgi:hypothetical protein
MSQPVVQTTKPHTKPACVYIADRYICSKQSLVLPLIFFHSYQHLYLHSSEKELRTQGIRRTRVQIVVGPCQSGSKSKSEVKSMGPCAGYDFIRKAQFYYTCCPCVFDIPEAEMTLCSEINSTPFPLYKLLYSR